MRAEERLPRRVLGRLRISKLVPADREHHPRVLVEECSHAGARGLVATSRSRDAAKHAPALA